MYYVSRQKYISISMQGCIQPTYLQYSHKNKPMCDFFACSCVHHMQFYHSFSCEIWLLAFQESYWKLPFCKTYASYWCTFKIFICITVYVCRQTCINLSLYAGIHVFNLICTFTYVCIHACVYFCINMYLGGYMMLLYRGIHVCTSLYIYACMYMSACICVCMYIHTCMWNFLSLRNNRIL